MTTFPIKGFLGTGATFEADLNLAIQVVMGLVLIVGSFLAKRKRYAAHGICQTTVLLLNLGMIGSIMWPSFQQQVRPALPKVFYKWYYAVSTIHALLGGTAQLLGLYIALVAGTQAVPQCLGFTNWKRWMRVELTLWLVVLLTDVATYCAWYITPFR